MREAICIEFQGQPYLGYRIVDRRRDRLFQTIFYGSDHRADGHAYRAEEGHYMADIAKIILRELVEMSQHRQAQHGR